jgi:N-acetylmuramoyl-L-alanine amidase
VSTDPPKLTIENHRLVGVPFMPDNHGPPLIDPKVCLIHYTATRSGPATARSLQHETLKQSISTLVCPDGEIIQQVPFNLVSWHAGKSTWRGRESVSFFSIGIEVVNPGPLLDDGETLFIEVDKSRKRLPHQKPWTGGVVEKRHRNPRWPFKFWCEYPDAQMTALAALVELLVREYKLECVTGHENVAPTRKMDPGPAFPWPAMHGAGLPVDDACYDDEDPDAA